jgi:integrator complex subunit 11
VDKHAVTNFFKAEDIKACMKKVRTVNLHEVVHVDDELQIKCYYAGHVLGAAMFEIRVGQQSVVYTVRFFQKKNFLASFQLTIFKGRL